VIAPTTPTGSRTISELPTFSSHCVCSMQSGIVANDIVGRPAWIIIDRFIGMPTSREISAAISSPRAASAAAIARQASSRSAIDDCDQTSKAARAAATARSTSPAVASGTRPMTSSVVESITSRTPPPPSGSTHSPPM
jgi:hypothetical protein